MKYHKSIIVFYLIFLISGSINYSQSQEQVYDPEKIKKYSDFLSVTTKSTDEELLSDFEKIMSQIISFSKESKQIESILNQYKIDYESFSQDYQSNNDLLNKKVSDYNLFLFVGYVESRVNDFAILTNGDERIALKSNMKLGEQINKYLLPIEGSTIYDAPNGSRLQLKNYSLVTDENVKAEFNSIVENLNIISGNIKSCYVNFVKKVNQILIESKTYYDSFIENPKQSATLIGNLNLVYPEIAKRAGIQGIVETLVFIDEKGNVLSVNLLKKIGAGCDQAAIDALMRSKFKPGLMNEVAVKVKIKYPVQFKLE